MVVLMLIIRVFIACEQDDDDGYYLFIELQDCQWQSNIESDSPARLRHLLMLTEQACERLSALEQIVPSLVASVQRMERQQQSRLLADTERNKIAQLKTNLLTRLDKLQLTQIKLKHLLAKLPVWVEWASMHTDQLKLTSQLNDAELLLSAIDNTHIDPVYLYDVDELIDKTTNE